MSAATPDLLFTEHLEWLKNITVKINLLSEMRNRLESIVPKYKDRGLTEEGEVYKTKFEKQKEILRSLIKQIKDHEEHLDIMDFSSQKLLVDHIQLRDEFSRVSGQFIELERNFEEFLG